MKTFHMSPEDAILAHRKLRSQTSMAIHFGTFPLGRDGMKEAPEHLKELLEKEDLGDTNFWILKEGEGREVPVLKPK